MLRISLQRFAQFATGRIRRGGHDRSGCAVPAAPRAELRAVSGSQLLNPLNSYYLVSSFPPTAVADVLGEGDKVVVGLVA